MEISGLPYPPPTYSWRRKPCDTRQCRPWSLAECVREEKNPWPCCGVNPSHLASILATVTVSFSLRQLFTILFIFIYIFFNFFSLSLSEKNLSHSFNSPATTHYKDRNEVLWKYSPLFFSDVTVKMNFRQYAC